MVIPFGVELLPKIMPELTKLFNKFQTDFQNKQCEASNIAVELENFLLKNLDTLSTHEGWCHLDYYGTDKHCACISDLLYKDKLKIDEQKYKLLDIEFKYRIYDIYRFFKAKKPDLYDYESLSKYFEHHDDFEEDAKVILLNKYKEILKLSQDLRKNYKLPKRQVGEELIFTYIEKRFLRLFNDESNSTQFQLESVK